MRVESCKEKKLKETCFVIRKLKVRIRLEGE